MTGVDSLTPPALIEPGSAATRVDSALSGGMGAVYRAHDVETGAQVVLKRVYAAGRADPRAVRGARLHSLPAGRARRPQAGRHRDYLPASMLVVPLMRDGPCVGALQIVDRRDGGAYSVGDLPRAVLFGELAAAALE